MKLNFRQGIARFQTDVAGNPTFLQKSDGSGQFIDLVVAPDPTIIAFAHKDSNYIVEEVKTVKKAWGPFTSTQTVYLYWDVNLLTGVLTRGSTLYPPMYSSSAPSSPVVDQHWFDTTETIMRVWNGAKWVDKIRVFAAFLSSGAIIRPYRLGSQAGIVGTFEGGNIVLDAYNKPLRQSDGTFVTTVTSMIIVNNSAKKVKFEAEILSGLAAEPIPKYSLVQMRPGKRLVLVRPADVDSRIAGIVTEDLYTNEVGYVITEGLVRNEGWNFSDDDVNRPIFSGVNGEITRNPPQSGVCQAGGFVYDKDSIYMNIQMPVILDDLTVPPVPPPPPPGVPIANFTASLTTGFAPLSVMFTNTTIGPTTGYEWDFTNDGVVDTVTASPTYVFSTPGYYTVRLRAINAFGFDDEIKENFIFVAAPPSPIGFTNLGVSLGGPNQAQQNTQFSISVTVTNDGNVTATNVTRTITIPDLKGQQVVVSNLPAGSTVSRSANRTIVSMPAIPTIASGLTYGPTIFKITAPPVSGALTIQAVVSSPETDSTIGDNTTAIAVEIRP